MVILNKMMYYDIHETLSYNAPLTIIGGGRGRGKTFSAKKVMLNTKPGNETMWITRTKEKAIETAKGFLKDIVSVYPKYDERYELTWVTMKEDTLTEGKKKTKYVYPIIVDRATQEPKVHFSSINVQNKGIPFPNIRRLIFDEFLIKPGTSERYGTDEITSFLDLFQTIARLRKDFQCIMIANEIDDYNPYFAFWGIENFNKKQRYTWVRKPDILMEWVPDKEEFIEEYKQSAFHRVVKGTAYDAYMMGTQALVTYDIKFKNIPEWASYEFNLLHNGNYIGIWKALGMLYVTSTGIDTHRIAYTPNVREAGNRRIYDAKLKSLIKEYLGKGGVYVTDKRARTWLLEWLQN